MEGIRHQQILAGEVKCPSNTPTKLSETLRASEGEQVSDNRLPPPYEMTPGDHEVDAVDVEAQMQHEEFAQPSEKEYGEK